jgi:endonuclease/exonuclease/phosphatase (EEP) superfamily protein YafD
MSCRFWLYTTAKRLGDRAIQASFWRGTLTVVGLLGIVVAAAGVAARFLPLTNHVIMFAATLCPYLSLAAVVAAALLLVARRWGPAVVATGLVTVAVAVQLPLYLGDDVAPGGASIRIVTANLRLGLADPRALVSLAQSEADVVALQELTPEEAVNVSKAGMDATFPFRALEARGYASGVGLWSRYPIRSAVQIPGFVMASVKARIRVDGVSVDPTIVVAHMSGPWPQPMEDWRDDLDLLPRTMTDAATQPGAGATLIVGDFNSTFDMRPFRELLSHGYRDGADQAGAGITPTYPGDMWIPPVIAIDHVLTRNCFATSVKTAALPGSDHRALVATVQIPR